VVTAEEAQAAAGLGGAIAELLGDHEPLPLLRVGMQDRFGESGKPAELMEHFHLTAPYVAEHARKLVGMKARPRTGSPVAAKR
jgi:transketolase